MKVKLKGVIIRTCYTCFGLHHRLSATELLKLPLFKKAKNKEFIKEVVLGDAPSLQSRAKKVRTYIHSLYVRM